MDDVIERGLISDKMEMDAMLEDFKKRRRLEACLCCLFVLFVWSYVAGLGWCGWSPGQ